MFDLKDIKLESATQNFTACAILENGLDDTAILKCSKQVAEITFVEVVIVVFKCNSVGDAQKAFLEEEPLCLASFSRSPVQHESVFGSGTQSLLLSLCSEYSVLFYWSQ